MIFATLQIICGVVLICCGVFAIILGVMSMTPSAPDAKPPSDTSRALGQLDVLESAMAAGMIESLQWSDDNHVIGWKWKGDK